MVTKSNFSCPNCGERRIFMKQRRDNDHPHGQWIHFGTLDVQCGRWNRRKIKQ